MLRFLMLTLTATLIASLALQQPWRRATPAHASAPARHAATGPPDRLRLALPPGFAQLDTGGDHVVWADAGRVHTVTLGAVPRDGSPLLLVAARTGAAFAQQVPGGRVTTPPRQLADGRVQLELVAGPRGHEIAVAQVWQRLPGVRLDAVVTLTSADGAWPLAPPGPRVRTS